MDTHHTPTNVNKTENFLSRSFRRTHPTLYVIKFLLFPELCYVVQRICEEPFLRKQMRVVQQFPLCIIVYKKLQTKDIVNIQ